MSKADQLKAFRIATAEAAARASKKSDGGGKTDQRAKTGNMPRSTRGEEGGSSGASGIARSTVQDAALERIAGVVARSSDKKSARSSAGSEQGASIPQVAGSNPAAQAKSRGRPKIEGKRPWEAEGVSRRTWYRRKKESAS